MLQVLTHEMKNGLEPNFLLRTDIEFLVSPHFCAKIGPLKNKSTFYKPDKIIGYATRHHQSRGHLIEKKIVVKANGKWGLISYGIFNLVPSF